VLGRCWQPYLIPQILHLITRPIGNDRTKVLVHIPVATRVRRISGGSAMRTPRSLAYQARVTAVPNDVYSDDTQL
jgi:hypothetical protein